MRGLDKKKGFTLIELMISLGFFTLLIIAIYAVLTMGDSTMKTGLTSIEVSQNARVGTGYMVKELYGAQVATVSISDGNSVTFQVPGNSNTIQYSLGGLGGKQLIRTEAGATKVLCNNVKTVQFSPSPFSGRTVSISLEIEKTSLSQRTLTKTLNVSAKVRN